MPSRKTTAPHPSPHFGEVFTAAEKSYAEAMNLFLVQRDWQRAKTSFTQFLEKFGGERDVEDMADRARVHLACCEGKLMPPPAEPLNPEEWLVYGVALSNQGRTQEALAALDRAREDENLEGRVHYVKAAALALAERFDEALEELRLAIDADPENKAYSLGDPDFEKLREQHGYVELVEPPLDGFDEYGDFDDEEFGDEPENQPNFDDPEKPAGF